MVEPGRDLRRIPTVIVSRHVKPGREAEFGEWMEQVRAAVRAQHGYLNDEFQPPDSRHPDEWVVTFQFRDGMSLETWLDSAERRELMEAGRELIVGDTRQQLLAVDRPVGAEPVTAVISSRVLPGRAAEYRAVHRDIAKRMHLTEGFLRSELFEAIPGVQDDTVVVFSFDSRAHLDAWLHSAARQALIERFEPLVEGERQLSVVGGYAGWFSADAGVTVKRWKQSIAVICGLFPTALALAVVRVNLVPGLPLVPAVFASNVIGSFAMSYLVMPRVTRVLGGWLRR